MTDVKIDLEDYRSLIDQVNDSIDLAQKSALAACKANTANEHLIIAFEAERKSDRATQKVMWVLIFALIASNLGLVGAKFIMPYLGG